MLFSEIQDFVSGAMNETDIDHLMALLTKYIKPLGFDMHTCVSIVDLRYAPQSALLLLEFPEAWVERYISQNYIETDIIFKKAKAEMRAFKWSEIGELDPKAQKIFREASEFGIRNGITVPISLPGYFPITVNIVGDHYDISDMDYHAIHLMAIHYCHAAIRIKSNNYEHEFHQITLTPREKDCLQWVAQGKREPDIAEILSISPHTVHTHMEKVRRKLNVSTSTQAAVRAVHCGLIIP